MESQKVCSRFCQTLKFKFMKITSGPIFTTCAKVSEKQLQTRGQMFSLSKEEPTSSELKAEAVESVKSCGV